MNGLPGAPYEGQDPAGYMTVPEFLGLFGRSADRCEAPILTGTTVASVTRHEGGYTVRTDAGRFVTRSVRRCHRCLCDPEGSVFCRAVA